MRKSYRFQTILWKYLGKAAWHFVTVPTDVSQDIDYFFSLDKKGFGSLPVEVKIGQTTWKTSIFTDKKLGSYLLPIKAEVRKKEGLNEDGKVFVILSL